MTARSRLSVVLAFVMIGLGIAFLVRTAAAGGGQVGILLGIGFLVAGAGRLYLERRRCGPQAPRPAARARRRLALLGRLRRDRVVDLLRARDHRAPRRRLHAVRAPRRRRALPHRRALVRGGDLRAPRDRRRGHVRPPRLQRPVRLPHRLGAVPRLPDRDRALGALRPALPRGRLPGERAREEPVGRRRRRLRDRGRRPRPARPAAVPLRPQHDHPRARRRRPARADRLRLRAPLLARCRDEGNRPRDGADRPLAALRDPARDARVHRSRDRGEPRRGGEAPGRRPAALALPRHRHGHHRLRRDRRGRSLGLPRPAHRARHRLAPRAAGRHRRGDPGPHDGRRRRR